MIGAASNAGGELLRMMTQHPQAKLAYVADGFSAGAKLTDIHAAVQGFYDPETVLLSDSDEDVEKILAGSDVLFLAVDPGKVFPLAEKALAKGVKVIDFGADIRFRDSSVWEKWYGVKCDYPQMCRDAVYSIPEIWRDQIKGKSLISNPGCYPTASALGLYPFVKNGLIEKNTIIVNAISGTTGAGRKPDFPKLHMVQDGNFKAYGVAGHRHTPEIEQSIEMIGGEKSTIIFQPHLAPMPRGIHVTIYGNLKKPLTNDEIYDLYQQYYKDEPFVIAHKAGDWPNTKWTTGTNFCHLAAAYEPRTNRIIICSVIDNIGKGAAGQAIQNMNIIFGLDETTGLLVPPLYP